MKHWVRNLLWLILVAAIAISSYFSWHWYTSKGAAVTYRSAAVARGNLLATISATGSLEPEDSIDVGAQVAGQISRFGTEGGKPDGKPLDRRSIVKTGDLLALIDPSLYKMALESAQAQLAQSNAQLAQSNAQLAQSNSQLVQSNANLAQCDANIKKAQADIQQMEAKKIQAEQDWSRAQKLKKETPEALADTTYDSYQATYLTAVANLASANAALDQVKAAQAQAQAAAVQAGAAIEQSKAGIQLAQASIKQSHASVDLAQRNVDYCTITSPVDGEVIDRRVNIGQTVVSSLNAPSLFLIAKDLTRMVIWVSVNEADIGSIHNGQPVTFTVDARPGVTFPGTVTKVRFDATMTQNVVTYPVEVSAKNPDGLLYPYMTANVQFELDRRTDVLKVPNGALRYVPTAEEQVAPESRADLDKLAQRGGSQEGLQTGNDAPSEENAAEAPASQPTEVRHKYPHGDSSEASTKPAGSQRAKKGHDKGLLWVLEGEFLKPIKVRLGMSDGTMTEVQGQDLKEGLKVVVSEQRPTGAPAAGASPFMPQMRRR
jgi:HlyD family secretion protein